MNLARLKNTVFNFLNLTALKSPKIVCLNILISIYFLDMEKRKYSIFVLWHFFSDMNLVAPSKKKI